jgi:hypothetical protein
VSAETIGAATNPSVRTLALITRTPDHLPISDLLVLTPQPVAIAVPGAFALVMHIDSIT